MRKYIKLFEQFKNHQEIESICRRYDIENYTINDDGSIDVDGNVTLSGLKLRSIPIKFNKVSGFFWAFDNNFKNCKNFPEFVGGSINIENSCLTSLEGFPKEVNGGIYISSNPDLENLDGFNIKVANDDLFLFNTGIYSFDNFPYCGNGTLHLPQPLKHLFSLFDHNIELIDAFNDYNIIKNPKTTEDKPRLKLANLNKFLTDYNFKEVTEKNQLFTIKKNYDVL